jgi:lipopolysaccharide transport system ATP-binding protein
VSGTVIRSEGLAKRYRVGQLQRYKGLRHVLAELLYAPFRAVLNGRPQMDRGRLSNNFVWALKDVSFEIKQGDAVGVIGRNGSGKTTLLRILSRITEPTEGVARVRGRVGSLLEVGTGFHPELTGRENIYLNGSILGMRKRELDGKLDAIVAFAEIEKFIDTPVKFYSSGMYVRLAFAVAAHLEPEILLVDEVLAVGDAVFQKKCLGKMGEVGRQGRTVIFVSHQMNAIRRLCSRVLWLENGRVTMFDSTVKVVSAYETTLSTMRLGSSRTEDPSGPVAARFLGWEILDPREEQPNLLTTQGAVRIKFTVQVSEPIRHGVHGISLFNSDNQLMWGWATYDLDLDPGIQALEYVLPGLPLKPGAYCWKVSLYSSLYSEGSLLDEWYCVPELIIATPPLTHPRDEWSGVLNVPCEFRVLGAPTCETPRSSMAESKSASRLGRSR